MRFDELELSPALLQAVTAEGYTTPTPIQQQAIPHVLAGRDLIGLAQTGTGKTAAFALPVLQRLKGPPAGSHRPIRCLVLTPTRELASQIGESFTTYGKHTGLKNTVIFGGVGQDAQVRAVRHGLDVLVATPGRLLDLLQQNLVKLDAVEVFVLDEADRMLDMGFIHDVRKVIARIPKKRQTLFFSATMPPDIQELADSILTNPVQVAVAPVSSTAERIAQSVYFVEKADKKSLLVHLLRNASISRVIVFTRTKHGANRVVEYLEKGQIEAAAIHGNKSQSARERALASFKAGTTRVLVATDIAARGIDIDDITHVVNFDLPNVPESYVHRIGRTARAGASGEAISFCEEEERPYLVDIERLTQQLVPVVQGHPFESRLPPPAPTNLDPRARVASAPRPQQRQDGGRRGHATGHQRPRTPHQDRAPQQERPAQQPRPQGAAKPAARPQGQQQARPQGGGGGRPQGGGGGRPQGSGGGRPAGGGGRPSGGGKPSGGFGRGRA